ncbi:MAG TPA: EVE domain-containing protein [Trueperaceae bacterium]|nr:EVE domain-containing protein [Trueperaceae bacterium]
MSAAWLVKSEPDAYSFDDLERDGRTMWDGVRNYQARNFMRDEMRVGDPVLFYHSNTAEPAVVGLARVASDAYPDPTQFDEADPHYDAKASKKRPRWYLVDIEPVRALVEPVTLAALKDDPDVEGLALVKRGNRLSVMPVDEPHLRHILALGGVDEGNPAGSS